jgi:hypothetical protein
MDGGMVVPARCAVPAIGHRSGRSSAIEQGVGRLKGRWTGGATRALRPPRAGVLVEVVTRVPPCERAAAPGLVGQGRPT